jgi:hypothetical protein
MSKAKTGKCVHCLKEGVELTSDHMFPKSWYPDATPENLEKWQFPSCFACNQRYSKIEDDLRNRFALTLNEAELIDDSTFAQKSRFPTNLSQTYPIIPVSQRCMDFHASSPS